MSDLASLPALRATRSDQAAYAGHALAIAKWTAGRLRQAGLEDSTGGDADEADERLAFGMRMSFDDDGDTADGAAVVANAPRRGIDARTRRTACSRSPTTANCVPRRWCAPNS